MKINDCLSQSTDELTKAEIPTARLDALVLLEDVTGHDRAWLLAHPEAEISSADQAKLKNLLNRRAQHEPLAYVRGRTEFYSRDFVINNDVLEPRPETETMIDLLKELIKNNKDLGQNNTPIRIADVGTGSGAIGITTALEVPNCTVDLVDIDKKALKIAKINVDKFTLSLNVIESDLIANLSDNYAILLCNLPYVPDDFKINLAAGHEPRLAIFGGRDGLDLYRKLFGHLVIRTNRPLYLLFESLPTQHAQLAQLASDNGYKLVETVDFIQVYKLSEND